MTGLREDEADQLGIRVAKLDKAAAQQRKISDQSKSQGTALSLPEPTPWPDPIDGAATSGPDRRRRF
jgi:hypothetical protein